MVYASKDNLLLVQGAISDLVNGKRKVSVDYTSPTGDKTRIQYSEVSLSELRKLEQDMQAALSPADIMTSIDVEII